jgi:hypothetical protein
MIRITCPVCQSRLNAKDQLAGQTRKCPKCGNPLVIPKMEEASESEALGLAVLDEPPPDQQVPVVTVGHLPHVAMPGRLNRQSRYLICDRTSVVATWQHNGQGWQLKTRGGYVSAARNPENLPAQGNHTLVELVLAATDEGPRLQGIRCFKLAEHWALIALAQGDDRICSRITGPGVLGREQKVAIRTYLAETLMREIWQDAREVMDYLANSEYIPPAP